MVSAVKYPQPNQQTAMPDQQGHTFAIGVVSTLFFLFGFITCLNDILVPHLKEVFNLTNTQASLVQFTFFGAYFLISIPASKLISQFGYKLSFIVGLALTTLGCFSFFISADFMIYSFFLGGLFILASGIVILQVAANPYLTILGGPEKASSRLIFAQGLNSLGTTLAPLLGSLILSDTNPADGIVKTQAELVQAAKAVELPYLGLAAFAVLIAVALAFYKFPANKPAKSTLTSHEEAQFRLFDYPSLVLGVIGIFVYVGAEVSIGSIMVNFISAPEIGNMSHQKAAQLLAYYWGGAMVGRFIGAYVTTKVKPHKVLFVHAIAAALLVSVTVFATGSLAMYAIIAVGFFNSIMFPTIFVLCTQSLGKYMEKASGIICVAIVGGALIPPLQAFVVDNINIHISYIVPLLCYLYIAFFALKVKSKV